MNIIREISQNLQYGRAKIVKELVQAAIEQGISAEVILNEGLLHGMGVIGDMFRRDEAYVPDVLIASRAMNAGSELLRPLLGQSGMGYSGKAVIGTVAGDLHDIGKNLVKMMMEGKGLEVVDLGVDVPAARFVEAAIREKAQVICCSALLTTTMSEMQKVVDASIKSGIRGKVTIMVGGAPVTESFCKKVGADIYAPDAASAAIEALKACVRI